MSNMISDYMHSQMPAAGKIVPVASNTFTMTVPTNTSNTRQRQRQGADVEISSVPISGSGPGLPRNYRKSTDMTDIDFNPSYKGRKITDMTDEIYNDIMEASHNVLNMQMGVQHGSPRLQLKQFQCSNSNPMNMQPSPRLNQYQYSNPNPVIPRHQPPSNHLVHPQQFCRPNFNQNQSYHGVPPQNQHRDQYRIGSQSDIVTNRGGMSQYLGNRNDNDQYLNASFEDDIKSKPLPISPVLNDNQDIYKKRANMHIRDRSMENDDANSTTSDDGDVEGDDITPSTGGKYQGGHRVYMKTTMGADENDSGDSASTKSSNDDYDTHTPTDSNDDLHDEPSNGGGGSPVDDSDNDLYPNGNVNVILPRFGYESRR